MSEHPILFTSEMVRAILDGRKTQTRRIINPQPIVFDRAGQPDYANLKDPKKKWQVGDTLWVRETWQAGVEWDDEKPSDIDPLCGGNDINYIADGRNPTEGWGKVRPSIFMPRWATRIFLEITNIRVERVQEIMGADCVCEGCPPLHPTDRYKAADEAHIWFQNLWDSINAKRGYGWDKNLWVWVREFQLNS